MSRSPFIRFTLAALGGALAAGAVLWALAVVNSDAGFVGSTATTGIGRLVPLLAGIVIAAVAVVLLRGRVRDDSVSHGGEASHRAVCPACGGEVRSLWRLCPHCGDRLASDDGD